MANNYRLITVLNASAGDEALASLTDSVKAKLESGATIKSFDIVGTKELAYEIEGQRSGSYVQAYFSAESDFPKELERVLKITDGVLRFLIVSVGE